MDALGAVQVALWFFQSVVWHSLEKWEDLFKPIMLQGWTCSNTKFSLHKTQCSQKSLLNFKSYYIIIWSLYEIIHVCTAVVDESEMWSSQ